ncbi:MAG TPA: hypothetical protein VNM92_05125 [Thermoanaerobaculia bacterium]|nr:hypothetical protein [Thermoanaerobaculia bacterium]
MTILRKYSLSVSLLLLTRIAWAQSLGPERAVSEPAPQPISYGRSSPAAASDGRDFLVVWNDCSSGPCSAYAVLVREDGTSSDAFDIGQSGQLQSKPPVVLWTGNEYIVESSSVLYRISADGVLLGKADDLLFSGSGYVDAVSRGVAITSLFPPGLVIGRDGRPIPTDFKGTMIAVTAFEEGFLVLGITPCCYEGATPEVRLLVIGADGKTLRSHPIPLSTAASPASIAWNGSRGVIVVPGYSRNRVILFDSSLALLKVLDTIGEGRPEVVWDGHSFLIADELRQPGRGRTLILTRISSDGVLLTGPDVVSAISSVPYTPSYALVSNGRTTLLTRITGATDYTGGALVGTLIGPGSNAAAERTFTIGPAPPAQDKPAVALGIDGDLIVWREAALPDQSPVLAIWIPRDPSQRPRVIEISEPRGKFDARPVVAFDGSDFLVVWTDRELIRSRKISGKGEPSPFVVEAGTRFARDLLRDLSWNGNAYLLLTSDAHAWRLDRDGAVMGTPVRFATFAEDAEAAVIGDTWYVAWNGFDDRYCQVTCTVSSSRGVFLTRLSSAGQLIDPQPLKLANLGWRVGIATDSQKLLLTWIAPDETNIDRISYSRVLPSLRPLDPLNRYLPIMINAHPYRLPSPIPTPNRAVPIFDGKGWSLAWTTSTPGGALLTMATLGVDSPQLGDGFAGPITVGDVRLRQILPEPVGLPNPALVVETRSGRTSIAYVRSITESRFGQLRRVFFRSSLSTTTRRRGSKP